MIKYNFDMIKVAIFISIGMLLFSYPIQAGNLAFEHKDAVNKLSIFDKIKFNLPFTTAGVSRGCSINPDESGIETAVSKTITCSNHEALVNVYTIETWTGEWDFVGEKDAPATISASPVNPAGTLALWAWECYYCPEVSDECVTGTKICTDVTGYKECINGEWVEKVCGSSYQCGGSGNCISVGVCSESWSCNQWSSCAGGTQYRSCTDTHYCTTTNSKPATMQSCSTEQTSTPTEPTETGKTNWGIIALIIGALIFISAMVWVLKG